jgi:hypothetical protein
MSVTAIASTAAAVVGAAKQAIEAAEAVVEAADRSCVVEVDNMTPESLELTGHSHESGGFAQSPAPRIEPFSPVIMSSHSTDFAQGAVGQAVFRGRDFLLTVKFSNPFVGENHAEIEISGARAGLFQTSATAGGGNTGALFRYTISHPVQDNWRFCGKCHGMFFNGGDQAAMRCPAGDFHLPLGFNFVLPHSVPEEPRAQTNWRFCGKCHGMFFNGGDQANHRCAGGGAHDPLGLVFTLPHDLAPNDALQNSWRFCGTCHGLFFNGGDPANHRCPSGAQHIPLGFDFALPHVK